MAIPRHFFWLVFSLYEVSVINVSALNNVPPTKGTLYYHKYQVTDAEAQKACAHSQTSCMNKNVRLK